MAAAPPKTGAPRQAGDGVLSRACPTSGAARAPSAGPRPTAAAARGQKRQRDQVPVSVPRPLRSRAAAPPQARKPPGLEASLRDLQAIVINLERRPDRLQGCANRLAAHCPWLSFSRFAATDGKAAPISESEVATSWHTGRNVVYQRKRAVRKGWDDLETYKERRLELSPGERGCASSHVRAWRRCVELAGESERPLVVFEDDAAPTPEFTRSLALALPALPRDAGMLYLGYSQAADWRREVSKEVVEAEYVWTTVGYIVWPAAARLLLSRLPVDEPVDNWLAGLTATGDLKAYCVRPKVVLQADAWNVNSDVAHSDEHYWGPCSDIQHSDEFYWGPEGEGAAGARPTLRLGAGSLLGLDSSDSESGGDEDGA